MGPSKSSSLRHTLRTYSTTHSREYIHLKLASDVCRGLIPHTCTHSSRISITPDRKLTRATIEPCAQWMMYCTSTYLVLSAPEKFGLLYPDSPPSRALPWFQIPTLSIHRQQGLALTPVAEENAFNPRIPSSAQRGKKASPPPKKTPLHR